MQPIYYKSITDIRRPACRVLMAGAERPPLGALFSGRSGSRKDLQPCSAGRVAPQHRLLITSCITHHSDGSLAHSLTHSLTHANETRQLSPLSHTPSISPAVTGGLPSCCRSRMHRTCRAGRNVWQQLASGARSSIELGTRAAGTRSTTRHQLRSFASGAVSSADAAAPDSGKKKNNSDSNGDSNSNSNSPQAEKRIIFSAIQPTGVPHLGNYLGALREWKRLQDGAGPGTTLLFSIVDLHAITVPRPSEQLRQHRREMLAALLAVGLDPDRCALFFQSGVPEVAELQWILSCTASTGYLSRMTQWKSKMQLGADASLEHAEARRALKHGLFSYPVLQAADILVHRATHVPVGEDQRQHLEFARECVTNFNHTYRTDLLVEPQTLIGSSLLSFSLSQTHVLTTKQNKTKQRRQERSCP